MGDELATMMWEATLRSLGADFPTWEMLVSQDPEAAEAVRIHAHAAREFYGISPKAERGAVGKAVALNRSIISLAERPHNADDEYLKGQRVLARKTLYALGEEV